MLEPQPQRHPLQTFQFWFVVLLSAGAAAAWKFDLLSSGNHRRVLPVITDEPMPPPPEGAEELPAAEPASIAESLVLTDVRTDAPIPPGSAAAAPLQQPEIDLPPPQEEPQLLHDAPPLQTVSATEPRMPESAPVQAETGPLPVIAVGDELSMEQVDRLIDGGQDVDAHRLLSGWYWQYPAQRPRLASRLNLLARRIYFQPQPHYLEPHKVRFGDRLETIAAKYSVPVDYIVRLNQIDPGRLRPGQSLKVIQGPFSVLVDLGRFELTVHAHGYYVVKLPMGLGEDAVLRAGTYHVSEKLTNPTYYGRSGVVAADDPLNPLGEHWLTLNNAEGTLRGIGMHGTIEPGAIGLKGSAGCLCLRESDVANLFALLTIGSEVVVRE
ncbi:L,D-transpeptidase family protein [Planctomicrobium sp. SH664]|uniref:L,D-transpeptidase family protein n=1 Tax=Planctomicrobium sp. SH664 TaxID=3448125 RepID=UPI003F5BB252